MTQLVYIYTASTKPMRKKALCLFFFFLVTATGSHVLAQTQTGGKWQSLFDLEFDKVHAAVRVLWDSIYNKPEAEVKAIVHQLDDDKGTSPSDEDIAKLCLLKSIYCHTFRHNYNNRDWKYWGNRAVTIAGSDGNDYIMQSCCLFLGDAYLAAANYDTAVFYLLKTVELSERLGYDEAFIVSNKISVSNVLYRTHNYRQCLAFCLTNFDIESKFLPITVITAYNNAGLSYLQLSNPDSAIYYFNKAGMYADKKKLGVWKGIVSGNIGDAYHAKGEDEKAMQYWQIDYDSSMKYGEQTNAGLTLAYMSQYQFNNGQKQKAISQLQWAAAINKSEPTNLLRIDKIRSSCYRKLNLHDSADYFLDEYYRLLDSINNVVSRNNYNLVEMRMAFEKNSSEFTILKKERKAEIIRRNLLIIALLASLFAGLLLYNRERLKTKLAKKEAEIAEAEKKSANDQLIIFTQTLLEKNEQIEKLSYSLQLQSTSNTEELVQQSLLTEFDWNRFKELFEKTYPSFFSKLKDMAPGITPSEMRLAALIKLNLGNKEMASMQGISLSSLRGNKTRLRQKLDLPPDVDLEDLVKQI
jgi:hypothetical protein